MRCLRLLFLPLLCLLARPAGAMVSMDLAQGCRSAIATAEHAAQLPPGLLGAIAQVESGRRDPASGEIAPWPWTADVEGTGYFYESKAEAVAAVRRFQAEGIRSIDVGCMQVNLQQHPDAFPSLEAAFDPATNAAYAARFLRELQEQTGDWQKAAGMYHSATPTLGTEYARKVMAALPDEQRRAGQSPLARAWSASLGSPFGTSGGLAAFAGRRPMGARFIPVAAEGGLVFAGAGAPGRSLAAYRAMPVMIGLQRHGLLLLRR